MTKYSKYAIMHSIRYATLRAAYLNDREENNSMAHYDDVPAFTTHQEVVEFITKAGRSYSPDRSHVGVIVHLESCAECIPDLRTPEELAKAADCCYAAACGGKVFMDTRYGLCRACQRFESEIFIQSVPAID